MNLGRNIRTGNSESLYEFFLRHNSAGCNEIEREAIIEFERWMPDPSWRPDNRAWGGFFKVIEFGALAGLLRQNEGAYSRLQKAILGVVGTTYDSSTWSELHVGSLLTNIGCDVTFVEEQRNSRTPDITFEATNKSSVDVEVVRGDEKRAHSENRKLMDSLVGAIGLNDQAHYAVFVSGYLDDCTIDSILDAVIEIKPGSRVDRPEKWCVVAGFPEEYGQFAGGACRNLAPDWLESGSSMWAASTRIGSPDPPTTHLISIPPVESYLNPIRRKADEPQRTGDHPYLIALDALQFLDAKNRIGAELTPFFKIWRHVTGVMVIYPFFSINLQSWRCQLFRNPHADRKLSTGELDMFSETQITIEVDQLLS